MAGETESAQGCQGSQGWKLWKRRQECWDPGDPFAEPAEHGNRLSGTHGKDPAQKACKAKI